MTSGYDEPAISPTNAERLASIRTPTTPAELKAEDEARERECKKEESEEVRAVLQNEMQRLDDETVKRQGGLKELEAFERETEREMEAAERECKAVEFRIAELHSDHEAQLQRLEETHSSASQYFDVDDQVDKIRTLKARTTESLLDILNNPRSNMRTKLIEQEQSSIAETVERVEEKHRAAAKACAAVETKLKSAISSVAHLRVKYAQVQKIIAEQTVIVHHCNVEEHAGHVELERIKARVSGQGIGEEIDKHKLNSSKIGRELQLLDQRLNKVVKTWRVTREVRQQQQDALWRAWEELTAMQDLQNSKKNRASEACTERDYVQQQIAIRERQRVENVRSVYQLREQLRLHKENIETIKKEIIDTEAEIDQLKLGALRCSDAVDISSSRLTVQPRNRDLMNENEKNKRALQAAEVDVDGAERRLVKLHERLVHAVQAVEDSENEIKYVQETMQQEKHETEEMKLDMVDIKKRVVNTRTELTDTNAVLGMWTTEISTKTKLQEEALEVLGRTGREMKDVRRRRTLIANDHNWEQLLLKHCEQKQQRTATQISAIEQRLADLQIISRAHRKALNEASTKASSLRVKLQTAETDLENLQDTVMKHQYAAYLTECERSVYWFLMRVLTKLDIDDAKRYVSSEINDIGVKDVFLERSATRLRELRQQKAELHASIAALRKELTATLQLVPPPLTSVHRDRLLMTDARIQQELFKAQLTDIALRHSELEDEVTTLQDTLNDITVDEAMDSPRLRQQSTTHSDQPSHYSNSQRGSEGADSNRGRRTSQLMGDGLDEEGVEDEGT